MQIRILNIARSVDQMWVTVFLSNHCNLRMTYTCLVDLGWVIGQTITK